MPTFKIILQEQGATKAKKNVDGLGKSLGGLTKKAGIVAGALFVAKKSFDAVVASVQAAGKFEGVQAGFDNLSKKTGFSTSAFDKFNKALDGTIKSTDLMTMANNAMLLGITDSEDQMAQMFDTAQRLAKAVGQDAAFGVNSLVTGIGRQSKLMLDNLGIMIDTQKAYDDYAATLGKTASELDETERKQAFTNAALEEAERLAASLGEEQMTLTDQFNQGKKAVADIAVNMGQLLTPAVSFLATGFVHAADAVANFLGRLNGVKIEEALVSTSMDKVNQALKDRKDEYDEINTQQTGALLTAKSFTLEERNRMSILETQIEKLQLRATLLAGMTEEERIQFAEKEAAHIKNMELQEQVHYAEDLQFTDRQVRHDFEMGAIKKIDDEKTKSRNKALKAIQLELNTAAEIHKQETKNAALGASTASQGLKQSIANATKKAIAELTASIFQHVPYPFSLILAATAGGLANSIIDRNLDAHIPAFAEGGSFVTGGDQLIRVGDNSTGREMVNVVPLDAAGEPTGGGGMINVNITGNVMSENYTEDIIIPHIKSALRRGEAIS